MKITQTDVDAMFGRLTRSLASLDIDTRSWYVQGGSKANGIAFRLYKGSQWGGVAGMVMPDGYLGMTKSEAYHTLHTMAQAVEFITDRQARQRAGIS